MPIIARAFRTTTTTTSNNIMTFAMTRNRLCLKIGERTCSFSLPLFLSFFLRTRTKRVLCFQLFIIFLYYRESSDSVTEAHLFSVYSKVMFIGEMSSQSCPSHRFFLRVYIREEKDSSENERETEIEKERENE